MRKTFPTLTLFVAAAIAPAFAHADTFTITSVPGGTAPNPFTLTFTLPATPAAGTITVGTGTFSITAATVRNGVTDPSDPLTFYTTATGGGLSDADSIFEPYGPQLFSGTVNAPTFLTGTFNLSNEATFVNGVPIPGATDYTITISAGNAVTITPEPSSLALLGTGVLGLAGAARRRFSR